MLPGTVRAKRFCANTGRGFCGVWALNFREVWVHGFCTVLVWRSRAGARLSWVLGWFESAPSSEGI